MNLTSLRPCLAAALLLGALSAASAQVAPASKPAEREMRPVPGRLYEPDKGGIVLLIAKPDMDATVMSNPFEVRVQPEMQTLDIAVEVGGVIRSKDASRHTALINGKVYSTNDLIDNGMRVYMVRPDDVIVEVDSKYVRVPRATKVTVRLPKFSTF